MRGLLLYFSSCARKIPFRFNTQVKWAQTQLECVSHSAPSPPQKIEFTEPKLNTTIKRKSHSPHFQENDKENQDKCQGTSWVFSNWCVRLWQNLEEQEKMSLLLFGMKLTSFQSYLKVSFNYFLCASENESKLKNLPGFETFLYTKKFYSDSNVSI